MGRMLGAFDTDNEIDRPDLNKCPDCGCFFPQDNCPVCGRECPEEMRAGNRKPIKKKKTKNSSGRVVFVDWYHSWWFILLTFFTFPLLSIVLLVTSPYKKRTKIIAIIIGVVYTVLSTYGISSIVRQFKGIWDKPVDTSLSREEYTAVCEEVTPEEFYRQAEGYTDKYVTATLTVTSKLTESEGYYSGGEYYTYYLCRDAEGGDFEILVRDCIQDNPQNLVPGDIVTVYGEGAGNVEIYDLDYYPHAAPCINMAYVTLSDK